MIYAPMRYGIKFYKLHHFKYILIKEKDLIQNQYTLKECVIILNMFELLCYFAKRQKISRCGCALLGYLNLKFVCVGQNQI